MIKNLSDYFFPEQEFYLQDAKYSKLEKVGNQEEHSLNCIDNIQVDVNIKLGVRVTVTRTLKFDPQELFELSVSFGALLKFVPEKKDELEWNKINLAEEFKNNGQFVTGNLMGRISLLIAQITSSFGQPPIILPPKIAGTIDNE